jgi:hypothetical protein
MAIPRPQPRVRPASSAAFPLRSAAAFPLFTFESFAAA